MSFIFQIIFFKIYQRDDGKWKKWKNKKKIRILLDMINLSFFFDICRWAIELKNKCITLCEEWVSTYVPLKPSISDRFDVRISPKDDCGISRKNRKIWKNRNKKNLSQRRKGKNIYYCYRKLDKEVLFNIEYYEIIY